MESFEKDIKLKNDLQRFNVEKSIIGTEAYNIEQGLMKGVSQEEILEKAKSGIYKPTKQNLKEGIAGQKYGIEKKDERRIPTQLEIKQNELKFAEQDKKEAKEYIDTYKNHPFADKINFNKKKLKDANSRIKEINEEINKLQHKETEAKDNNKILYKYQNENVVKEEHFNDKYDKIYFENGNYKYVSKETVAELKKK